MIEHRPFNRLGKANHGWLNARHHFSFSDFYDPKNMGWGAIRVRAGSGAAMSSTIVSMVAWR